MVFPMPFVIFVMAVSMFGLAIVLIMNGHRAVTRPVMVMMKALACIIRGMKTTESTAMVIVKWIVIIYHLSDNTTISLNVHHHKHISPSHDQLKSVATSERHPSGVHQVKSTVFMLDGMINFIGNLPVLLHSQ